MDAHPYALKQILSPERRYVIPTFQRDYEWTRDGQWQLLFDDLEDVAERLEAARHAAEAAGQDASHADKRVGPHFLGAVVLDQLPSPAGGLDVRAVIDGQQRLTTIQLVLRGLLDALLGIQSQRTKQVRRLIENPEDVAANADERHKLWPRRHDPGMWRAVMGSEPVAGGHPYADARKYFHERADAFIGTGADADARAALLVDAALDLFKLVVIDLEENDDAQVIFEVLNGRQTPLTAADLVKNLLFLRAERAHEGQLEDLYDKYWSQFDDAWWKKEIGIGHAARRHTDMLLAAWLTASSGDDASPGRLYGQIRAHLDSSGQTVGHTLQEISRFAQEYRVINGVAYEPNDRMRIAYARLLTLGVTTAYPLLLWLRTVPPDKLPMFGHLAAVLATESFVIRRMIVGAQTRGYGQIFTEVLAKAKATSAEGGDVAQAVRRALASNAQSRTWPTDDEVTSAFKSRRFYGVDATWRIRLILGAVDERLRIANPKTEPAAFTYDQLTVEHVMPQSWGEHWPLPSCLGEDMTLAEQRRDEAVNRIGNLTLVTKALNPALSNAAWSDKRAALAQSALVLNSQLMAIESWDETAIQDRGVALAKVAQEEWPGPPAPLSG